MCPICLATLDKAADGTLRLDDISAFLGESYCPVAATTP
jgi:hypothetical protein